VPVREILNAIFYVLSTGCRWQALPKDLPPKSTAHYYFALWDLDGTLKRLHHALYVVTREREGREVSPSAAITHSQSARAAQKGPRA
jgi:putative transposase